MRASRSLLLQLLMGGVAAAQACQPPHEDALAALNAVRALPQACGVVTKPAAPLLQWQPVLAESARRHAVELATLDRLGHVSASGATLRARLREAGYAMRLSGENIAGGPETLDEALAQWLASPAHCENLMLAEFEDVGLACVAGSGQLQRYWVLQLATPATRPATRPARPAVRSSPDQSP